MPEVGVVGDWISPWEFNPDVFTEIAVFESFERSDRDLNVPGGGDVECSEGESTEVDRVSLVRETSVSIEVRLFENFSAIGSVMPCFLELSDGGVGERGSSTEIGG